MKMKIELSCREDNHKKKYSALLIAGNIIVDKNNLLPSCGDSYINFKSQYSPIYSHVSNKLVNTRFTYPYSGGYKESGKEGIYRIYAKLYFWERLKLLFIERKSWFHLHPISTFAMIINLILGIVNIYFGYVNISSSSKLNDKLIIQNQNEVLNMQTNLLNEQTKLLKEISSENHSVKIDIKDSLKTSK